MSLYQPFLDYAIDLMKNRLDLQLGPIPIEFLHKKGTMGKGEKLELVTTSSYAFSAPKLRHIRAALLTGSDFFQVLNFVIFPSLDYDLPFFGADLVTLPKGHLIALDLQPLWTDRTYQAHYTNPLLPIFQAHQQYLPWGGDFPEEAKAFFSPIFLWSRPTAMETVQTRVFTAFCDYLNAYLDLVNVAAPIKDKQKLAAIVAAHQCYIQYRSTKDPARAMFTKLYGPEWTENYIHQFLFK